MRYCLQHPQLIQSFQAFLACEALDIMGAIQKRPVHGTVRTILSPKAKLWVQRAWKPTRLQSVCTCLSRWPKELLCQDIVTVQAVCSLFMFSFVSSIHISQPRLCNFNHIGVVKAMTNGIIPHCHYYISLWAERFHCINQNVHGYPH